MQISSVCSGAAMSLCGLLMSGTGVAHADQALDTLRSSGRIVLAHRESSVPFSFLDAKGNPAGYALDICARLVQAVQKSAKLDPLRVDYLLVTSSNRIEAIEQGRAQLECGSTTNNAARREKVAFTIPHYITGARMLVRANSGFKLLDDAGLKKVVSTINTTPLVALQRLKRQRDWKFEILEAPDHQTAASMVEKGEADAFVMDDVLLYGLASGRADAGALKVTGRFITTEPLAVMLPKGSPEFKKMVDDEMRRLIRSGEINQIYDKWFLQPIAPGKAPLNLPVSYLLRDLWKYPTDKMP